MTHVVVASLLALSADAASATPAAAAKPDARLDSESGAGSGHAVEPSGLGRAEGMLMLDYQTIPVPSGKSLDLIGFHVFNRLTDSIYLGVGGHAPLFRGEYGGFMAFDVTAHARRRLFGNVFGQAGLSVGGGGGGKSVQQSRVLSGTGGFVKTYLGLGVDFGHLSVGANVAHMRFKDSSIDNSQLNLFVQAPFGYQLGSYGDAGRSVSAGPSGAAAGDSGESVLTLGLDNLSQVDPQGLNKETINLVDLQFSHFFAPHTYWFFNAAGGYRGRPLYNHVFGGLGYRARLGPRLALSGQLGIGSGGYAPETIDTGPGLLVYPKISAEYAIDRNLGLSLSAGYLVAPKASSKNLTFGAALHYHLHGGANGGEPASLSGYRLNLLQQTASRVVFRGAAQPDLQMLTMQIDSVLGEHFYLPVQVSAAYNAYLNLPGYGELLAGVGVQNRYRKGDRFQLFGQLLVGANVHGGIVKTGLGLNVRIDDRWALYAVAGTTSASLGSNKDEFRANHVGVGLTYRFSVPTR